MAERELYDHALLQGALAGVFAAQPPLRSVLLPNVPNARGVVELVVEQPE